VEQLVREIANGSSGALSAPVVSSIQVGPCDFDIFEHGHYVYRVAVGHGLRVATLRKWHCLGENEHEPIIVFDVASLEATCLNCRHECSHFIPGKVGGWGRRVGNDGPAIDVYV
jgi:hypothetical protein